MGKLLVLLAGLAALAWLLLPRPRKSRGRLLTGFALCLPFILFLVGILLLRL